MVLIERVRRLIRPGTLSVRLAANMVAGHILLALLARAYALDLGPLVEDVVIVHVLLAGLEVAVAAIQAYVLTILRVLYAREV